MPATLPELNVLVLVSNTTVTSMVPPAGQVTLSIWHVGEHPSPATVLPSSHCSPGRLAGFVWMTPSPHVVSLQSELQVGSSVTGLDEPFWPPGSHSSTPASTLPSPHRAVWQASVHLTVGLFAGPSSQLSPGSTTPLPQSCPCWSGRAP